MEKNVKQSEVLRKRGRPAGKNRVPLSMEERRARNAQYERERREGMSGALSELAAAAGCHSSISGAELLATVITQLQQVKDAEDLDTLRRYNENLMAQIEMLEQRLDSDDGCSARTQGEVVKSRPAKRKRENDDDSTFVSLPKRSPPEDTSPASPPARITVQQCPGPSSSEYYSAEQYRFPDSTSTEDHERIYAEAKCVLSRDLLSADPWLPGTAMSTQHFLPVPKISPTSNASDQPENEVDYASFSEAPVPTPMCQLDSPVESSEYSHCAQQVWPSPQHYHHSLYSPLEQASPPQYLGPETFPSSSTQPCLSGPLSQHLVEVTKCSSDFSFKEEYKNVQPTFSPKQEFRPVDPWLPNAAMSSQEFLPESRTWPVNHAPDLQQHNLHYSSYHFAGPQIPTPEYRTESAFEASERIQPVQPYTEVCYHSPQQCRSGFSSPEGPFSPSQCLIPWIDHGSSSQRCHSGHLSPEERFEPPQYIPEMNYGVCTSRQSPVYQANVFGSVGVVPMPGSPDVPNMNSHAQRDLRQGQFLSTEDLISIYF